MSTATTIAASILMFGGYALMVCGVWVLFGYGWASVIAGGFSMWIASVIIEERDN
jgi:hypothetical protein